jgi:hypothetical protein
MNHNERQRRQSISPGTTNLRPFDDFLLEIGKSRGTGRRWRKAGLIQTLNIQGKVYVSLAAIREFETRAARGEFAKCAQAKVPVRRRLRSTK